MLKCQVEIKSTRIDRLTFLVSIYIFIFHSRYLNPFLIVIKDKVVRRMLCCSSRASCLIT